MSKSHLCSVLAVALAATAFSSLGYAQNFDRPGTASEQPGTPQSEIQPSSAEPSVPNDSPAVASTPSQTTTNVPTIAQPVTPAPVAQPVAPPPAVSAPEPTPPPVVETDKSINKSRSLGFGAAILGGSGATPITVGGDLNFRIWATDFLALQPSLVSNTEYDKSTKRTEYLTSPQFEFLFAAYRHNRSRVNIGTGIGYHWRGQSTEKTTSSTSSSSSSSSSSTSSSSADFNQHTLYIPLEFQLEHFLASWFSLQVGARCNVLRYTTAKPTNGTSTYAVATGIDSTVLKLGFMFYTD